MVDFDVVELEEADHVEVGEQAPDFVRPLVNDEYWQNTSLSELTDDGPVLLVFHPMDGAFPSTYIWNELRDRELGEQLTVVGCSISDPYAHKRFIGERGMDYRLFSDPSAKVAREYGIDHELDGMAGIREPRPAVFLLDEERTVQYAWVASQWPEFPDYDEIESAVESHT
ncbi:Peroxiredoxin [Halogranum rubrum]|uniref:Peroxiredoxin n=1 Tax=Halogranum rubrum TaxID=553466 RepID=A0A1I4GBA3_9EURY|nr:redoxin domain-containing protein [Halogranum rubrum]SFL26431.1 Peroxiredoxin [Halogranum rubrum]